ncbi:MAG: hypothetical protein U5K51_12625 [Flavobacteriaceae bacterium]|nr:hypothetical protein [Flavobacteriaceae bacterium]
MVLLGREGAGGGGGWCSLGLYLEPENNARAFRKAGENNNLFRNGIKMAQTASSDEVIVTVNEVTAKYWPGYFNQRRGNYLFNHHWRETLYLWSTGETSETIAVSPTTTTTYSVTVTKNGCKVTDEVKVTVNACEQAAVRSRQDAEKDISICARYQRNPNSLRRIKL